MERILQIADSFYMLNDIKINKKKSALLIRFKEKKRLNNEINLQLGNEEIGIQPVQHNGSERFLGVWINMYNKNKHIQQQVKNKINDKEILGEIMDIRLTSIQNLLLLENNPLYNDTIIERFKVEGEPITVRLIISKDIYLNNFRFLQNSNIRYIDQIISLSKRYLLTIKELEDRKYVRLNLKGKLSANINNYEQIRGIEIIPVIANTKKDVPIIIELNTRGSLQAVFGRTRKVLPGRLLIAMHMIPIITIEDKDLILEECQGCNITTWLDVENEWILENPDGSVG
ncbi:hypothetical protein RhiirA5_439285 [Rhizophagus irregularis]|uniref:Uncharacterized protein n=1 Tax=Rhizophagus irregularis TaxID=588596 RepID=A0A2N0NI14_9GLOM|nr:hypothetical protein RhiirA5_439285 [Rhizophagus irregularis]